MMKAEILKRLYYDMLRIRMTEEKIADLYPEQEMRCPTHLCIGQEAVAAGVCAHLSTDDYVMSTHRSHGHYLAKGGDLKALIAELYGRATGCAMGKGGSMHLVDLPAGFIGATPIVGSTIPIAVGAAFGATMQGEHGRVSVVFFGEAATEEGVFHEAINFAILKKLPVLFVCENNLYSVYSPLEVRQPENRVIHEWVNAYGMETHHGDGNDVVEVYDITGQAIRKIRQGEGPIFLEFDTYRVREHVGPDYDTDLDYREASEVAAWEARDPIAKVKQYLLENGHTDEQELAGISGELADEIEAAFVFAKESPYPEAHLLAAHVYAP